MPAAIVAAVGLAGIGIGLWCVLSRRMEPRDGAAGDRASAEEVHVPEAAMRLDGYKRTLADLLAPAITHALGSLHAAGHRAHTGRSNTMPRPSE